MSLTGGSIALGNANAGGGGNGWAGGNGGSACGGRILASGVRQGGGLTLSQFTITFNYARGGAGGSGTINSGGAGGQATGGGVALQSGITSAISGTTVSNNQAIGGNGGTGGPSIAGGAGGAGIGGGIASAGTTTITNGTISANLAQGGNGGNSGTGGTGGNGGNGLGGGVAVTAGQVTFQGGTASSNTARGGNGGSVGLKGVGGNGGNGFGGGIYVANNALLALIDAAIGGFLAGNSAIGGSAGSGGFFGTNGTNGQGVGGGLYLTSAGSTKHNTTVSFNFASTSDNDIHGPINNDGQRIFHSLTSEVQDLVNPEPPMSLPLRPCNPAGRGVGAGRPDTRRKGGGGGQQAGIRFYRPDTWGCTRPVAGHRGQPGRVVWGPQPGVRRRPRAPRWRPWSGCRTWGGIGSASSWTGRARACSPPSSPGPSPGSRRSSSPTSRPAGSSTLVGLIRREDALASTWSRPNSRRRWPAKSPGSMRSSRRGTRPGAGWARRRPSSCSSGSCLGCPSRSGSTAASACTPRPPATPRAPPARSSTASSCWRGSRPCRMRCGRACWPWTAARRSARVRPSGRPSGPTRGRTCRSRRSCASSRPAPFRPSGRPTWCARPGGPRSGGGSTGRSLDDALLAVGQDAVFAAGLGAAVRHGRRDPRRRRAASDPGGLCRGARRRPARWRKARRWPGRTELGIRLCRGR